MGNPARYKLGGHMSHRAIIRQEILLMLQRLGVHLSVRHAVEARVTANRIIARINATFEEVEDEVDSADGGSTTDVVRSSD